ncbi:MAG: UDP-N-acetylglucosamine 2-epimerase (non-hydrolyzing) [Bryobacteraceae bacterium]|nr:UDP-N-acetylglucosamine 2-epimerase (non-hydrolyzing) [Bryobacteraceae bacterium]
MRWRRLRRANAVTPGASEVGSGVAVVVGTRPEAIKLAPVVLELRGRGVRTTIVGTGQHPEMARTMLGVFGLAPDVELRCEGGSLAESAASILTGLDGALGELRPDWVLVQGDTTSAFCGALASFYRRLRCAHVEAGLRTWNLDHPFPEEANRLLIGRLAALHFAPTERAAENLRAEGIAAGSICVTGNTGIDALLLVRGGSAASICDGARRIVVTIHRRENHGELDVLAETLRELAARGFEVVLPVHPNPVVKAAFERLRGCKGVVLTEPLEYREFVALLDSAWLILTDSGGIQEEAPSLGKPVLVLRETTERPEAVEAGTAVLVGTDRGRILGEVELLASREEEYARRAGIANPFGDGRASERIADRLLG